MILKNLFNCGYRCLVVSSKWNHIKIKRLYKRVNFKDGVSMENIKNLLEEKVSVDAYELDDVSYVTSNMIVHTFYKGKGHYIYVINVGNKRLSLYDPRRIFKYRIVSRDKISKFIDVNNPIRALMINENINYKLDIYLNLIYLASFITILIGNKKIMLLDIVLLLIILIYLKIMKKD